MNKILKDVFKDFKGANQILNCEIQEMNLYKKVNGYMGFTTVVIDTGIYPHIDFLLGKNRLIKFGSDKMIYAIFLKKSISNIRIEYGISYRFAV